MQKERKFSSKFVQAFSFAHTRWTKYALAALSRRATVASSGNEV